MNIDINNYRGELFVLNLERRPDRKEEARQEFARVGLLHQVTWIKATDGKLLDFPRTISADQQIVSQGDLGCTRSHLHCACVAMEEGHPWYGVFEDDVVFHKDFVELFPEFLKNVPDDWDMIYFGGNHDQPLQPVNRYVSRMTRTFTTHAMIVRSTIYDALIDVLNRVEKVDVAICSLHARYNCYVFQPHLAIQRPSYSDILERYADYQHLISNGQQYA